MFTGLVQAIGKLETKQLSPQKLILEISTPELFKQVQIGDSVSVNGVCLTVESLQLNSARFFISSETMERTNLAELQEGSFVNLELALQADSFMGGHWVQGHVDACGKVLEIREGEQVHFVRIGFLDSISRHLVEKGSIAINGVSLTLNSVNKNDFEICIIPRTWEKTTFPYLKVNDKVNIEVDILSKYVEKHLKAFFNKENLYENCQHSRTH